ncbi:hypothetical protein KAV79_03555 [Candidatus Aerophobetes bacterium]|nr:hypothetical protein [Candidatus Aerophobetes bacterium]
MQFLKLKQLIVKNRKEVAIEALELKKEMGIGAKAIHEQINCPYVNLRFIERSIYEGRKTEPRVSFNSLSFQEFLKKQTEGLGYSGMLWDEIVSKRACKFQ